jgi:hypothetical protein
MKPRCIEIVEAVVPERSVEVTLAQLTSKVTENCGHPFLK